MPIEIEELTKWQYCQLNTFLREVAERGEDENAHEDEEEEQAQLLAAVSQREGERLKSRGVAREFEDPEDAADPEDLHDAADVVEAAGAGVGLDEEHGDEVRQDGEHVNYVHTAADELAFLGGA